MASGLAALRWLRLQNRVVYMRLQKYNLQYFLFVIKSKIKHIKTNSVNFFLLIIYQFFLYKFVRNLVLNSSKFF
jgi:hypothetical protein